MKLLLECGDVNPNSADRNSQKPLSYAITRGREGVVRLLSDSRIPNRQSPENSDRMPTSVTNKSASHKEVTPPPAAMEPAISDIANDLRKRKWTGEQGRLERKRNGNRISKRDKGSEKGSNEDEEETEISNGARG